MSTQPCASSRLIWIFPSRSRFDLRAPRRLEPCSAVPCSSKHELRPLFAFRTSMMRLAWEAFGRLAAGGARAMDRETA